MSFSRYFINGSVLMAFLLAGMAGCKPAENSVSGGASHPAVSGENSFHTELPANRSTNPTGSAQLGGGGIDSGGGDPLAVQFLQILRFLEVTQRTAPIAGLDIESPRLKSILSKLEESLEGKSPLVIFPEGKTVDCLGVPKLGCFKEQKIYFARTGWTDANLATKVQVSTMEIFMALGEKDRYLKAELVSKAFANKLVLTDGNIHPPTSTEAASKELLLRLNERENPVRLFVLKAWATNNDSRLSAETEGIATYEPKKSSYKFTEQDVASVVFLGKSNVDAICKDDCQGLTDTESRDFLIAMKASVVSQSGTTAQAVMLKLSFTSEMQVDDGSIKNSIDLGPYQSIYEDDGQPTAEREII